MYALSNCTTADRCMCSRPCQDAGQVTRLGEELGKLFELHKQVYQLALEGSKSGGKKGRKKGPGAATAAEQGTAPQVSKPSLILVTSAT